MIRFPFLRSVIILMLMLVAHAAAHARVEIPDSIRERLDAPGTAMEGVWQFVEDGAVMAVVADGNGGYRIISLDSPYLTLEPGTVIGTAHPVDATGRVFRWETYTGQDSDGRLCSRRSFDVSLSDDDARRLSMTPVAKGIRLNLWMLYRFFVTLSARDNRKEKKLDAIRIYPDGEYNVLNAIVL